MLIEFVRNGKTKRINPALARVLEKKGHVRIVDVGVQTVAVEKPAVVETVTQPDAVEQVSEESVVQSEGPDLDAMDIDQLRDLAAALSVPVHHRSGEEKIRADIRAHMQ